MREQLSTLLALLRDEMVAEIALSDQAVLAWQVGEQEPRDCAVTLQGVLERCMCAAGVLSMEGLVDYLQHLHDGLAQADVAPAYLEWAARWHQPTMHYLEEPASEASVDAVFGHLAECPLPLTEDMLHLLRTLLGLPPVLPYEPDEPRVASTSAQPEDLSLMTEEIDPELLAALLRDAPDQLQRLSQIVRSVGLDIESDPNLLREAQRIAHTLKGSALIVGVPGIGNVAHRMEDLLAFVGRRLLQGVGLPAGIVRDISHGVDALEQVLDYLAGDDPDPLDLSALVRRFADWAAVIEQGSADEASFPALGMAKAEGAAVAATPKDTATLRVAADTVGSFIRQAGEAIVNAQRLDQAVRDSLGRLRQMEASHASLTARLRELEVIVARQVTRLEEQEEGFDPLEMDRYDALSTISRFISEAAADTRQLAANASQDLVAANGWLVQQAHVLREHHRALLQARLVPFQTVLSRMRRNVQHTAAATGKVVRLEVSGDDVRMDADVLARLTEPLLHILRNAVDHGIEDAARREAAGKGEGVVRLAISQAGNELLVACSDDGGGLDVEAIRAKAVDFGILAPDAPLALEQAARMILEAGFSTKDGVTEISGRGVGMDVVNDRVIALKGRLDVTSVPGQGTRIEMRVPVSTGLVKALIVRSAGCLVAIPCDQVRRIHSALDGELPGALRLSDWLGWSGRAHDEAVAAYVVVEAATGQVPLGVEEVLASRELVLQDVGRLLRRIPGLSAGSTGNGGEPLLVLDVRALERAGGDHPNPMARSALRERARVRKTKVLVVDDSLSVRKTISQLLQDNGYEPVVAADGFEALAAIREEPPATVVTDLEMPNLNGLELTRRLRASDQHRELPILMLTSRNTEKHRRSAREAGVDTYLSKPYTDVELLQALGQLVARAPAAIAAAAPATDAAMEFTAVVG